MPAAGGNTQVAFKENSGRSGSDLRNDTKRKSAGKGSDDLQNDSVGRFNSELELGA